MRGKHFTCDLKVEISNLPEKTILELLHCSIEDNFNIIGLCQTAELGKNYKSYNIKKLKAKYFETYSEDISDVLVLNRANFMVENANQISRFPRGKIIEGADLVSLEFKDLDTLTNCLNLYQNNSIMQITKKQSLFFCDHLFYIDLQRFPISSTCLKILSAKGVFVEFGYSDLILQSNSQNTAFINFFRLMESQIKKLIVSSNTGRLLFKRNAQEVRDLFKGLLVNSMKKNESVAKKMMGEIPVKLIKMAKIKRSGPIQVLKI